ncbi:MAG: hypothetical protein ACXIUW_06255 [Roseinatronobacter sp.]
MIVDAARGLNVRIGVGAQDPVRLQWAEIVVELAKESHLVTHPLMTASAVPPII